MKRRSFFAASLLSAGLAGYSYNRGMRMPPLRWEPQKLPNRIQKKGLEIVTNGLIGVSTPVLDQQSDLLFRAFVPEPKLTLISAENTTFVVSVNNISPEAKLNVSDLQAVSVEEQTIGITRLLTINMPAGSKIELSFDLDVSKGFTFAAIGDTGGQLELDWCLQRAQQLGALFLLHLGDFYYAQGDYERAISKFNNAPLPCYVSIGNHDFHDGQTVYQKFLADIGPFNASFSLGNVEFANVDTASSFIPWNRGQRGQMLAHLQRQQNSARSKIAFTHRPLFDPIEDSSHDIGNSAERDWLISALKKAGFTTLISGHIHIHARDSIQGIDNIIVGQGLGHQDLITDQDYSKMVLADVDSEGAVQIDFAPLSMPWKLHCHPRSDIVKESLVDAPHAVKIAQLKTICNDT